MKKGVFTRVLELGVTLFVPSHCTGLVSKAYDLFFFFFFHLFAMRTWLLRMISFAALSGGVTLSDFIRSDTLGCGASLHVASF